MPQSPPTPAADPDDARLPFVVAAIVVVEAITILGLYVFGRVFS
jgi:hypothetical protein